MIQMIVIMVLCVVSGVTWKANAQQPGGANQGEVSQLRQDMQSLHRQAQQLRSQLEQIRAQAKPLEERLHKIYEAMRADREKLEHLRDQYSREHHWQNNMR